ncbi:MAG: 4a-hydroxytetrahydrobiopterin dehydratase [Gammaproteobacteria bacterium]|uniref:4a-hydroxytetrahydrobiopterin dehydratase n=1 Tax=Rhodoferax sp. TaxID=50421 RepID=UPI0017F5BFE1|nr:4a-hydroxytetrahydrobiopterin dehydratase [Rhodoferax sp.]MBU3897786.1 4a-hydroxytetrahydrobiopterin dehydratase [Gammaproteobacteria bacterium]MBA3056536.1 4a-hydroxytetrahydrobiopterin dehydratase [Rhodoferax sp.]MBU3997267.1 4a-hydroxytetrahydrobiopterin dehydratase [Gammaproteobacteria bacterium]MBU4017861.1 4a-hydroxytetrahydrobiopterin dehydratase [Gammaproteobacteria bacterium]MBU4078684.1 4a-hydroxytetrahydrobiopterin dehydratase [Gammaproteobacteria bacterium]
MNTILKTNEALAPARPAFSATEIVTNLAKLEGWQLSGDGADVAIEKTFSFANYHETMAFVNALAFIAHRQDHHPDLSVRFNRCAVRFNTHDIGGLSRSDFDCAARVEALFA